MVLTFLPEESCGFERDGRAATDETVAVKVEPTWDDEDWDEEGNWVGEPAVPKPDSGEEDWYENGTLDDFLPEDGEAWEDQGSVGHEDSWAADGEAWCCAGLQCMLFLQLLSSGCRLAS